MSKLIYFPEDKFYGKVKFEGTCTYKLSEDEGFADRWLSRGCKEVEKAEGKVFDDPRFEKEEKKAEPVAQKKAPAKKAQSKASEKPVKKEESKDEKKKD